MWNLIEKYKTLTKCIENVPHSKTVKQISIKYIITVFCCTYFWYSNKNNENY